MRQKIQLTAATLAACLAAPAVQATNGYMPHGIGTASKGMAGAGSALPQDSFIVYSNPAGLARLDKRFDVEVDFFMPERGYTANDDGPPPPFPSIPAGNFQSSEDMFLIPGFAMNIPLNDKHTVGVSLLGHGGMNSEYDNRVFENFAAPPGSLFNPTGEFSPGSPTGIDLAQLVMGVSYAYKVSPNQSIGITPMLAAQRIKVRGLQPFKPLSVSPNNLTNNGYDYSYGGGVRVGWMATWFDSYNVAVSYQSRLFMSDFNDYKGLFASGGKFDIPPVLNVGLSFNLTPKLAVAADFKRIWYGDINALNNTNNVAFSQLSGEKRLGGGDGLGFGWEDVNVFSIGLQYEYNSQWTFRGGFSNGEEPWKDVNTLFNILAPATIKNHASIGATFQFTKDSAIVASYTHAFENKIHGTSTFTGSQTGYVEMYQNDFQIAYSRHF